MPQLTWTPTNAPAAASRYDDIWFLDPDVGWAVNSNGHVLKTADGGASWQQQFASGAYLRCVGFADSQRGWVGTLTPGTQLFQTVDGGATWARANLPTNAPVRVCGLSVVNQNVVYASGTNIPGDPPRMMKTTDGGGAWHAWDMSPHATILIDCFFTDDQHGWVVGGIAQVADPNRSDLRPVVLETNDGGRNWIDRVATIRDTFPFGEWGWKIQFLDAQVGFVSLENFDAGAILRTSDGGATWERMAVNDPQGNANLEGIGFVDPLNGWVGGWGTADFSGGFSSATSDGGSTWQNANEIGRFINRFRFFGNPVTVGYASGLTVYKYAAAPVPAPAAALVALGTRLLSDNSPRRSGRPVQFEFVVPVGARNLALDIWDRFGTYVGCVLKESRPTGQRRRLSWDGRAPDGRPVADGIYIFRLTVDTEAESGVILLSNGSTHTSEAPMADFYRPPADIGDFSRSQHAAQLRQNWHDYIGGAVASRDGGLFYDAFQDPAPGTQPAKLPIPWNGFPRSIWQWFNADADPNGPTKAYAAAETLRPITYRAVPNGLGQFNRQLQLLRPGMPPLRRIVNGALSTPVIPAYRQQDEYCEWHVDRQGTAITRISFTAEGPEYWEQLASLDLDLVTTLYQELVNPAVTQEQLVWDADIAGPRLDANGQLLGYVKLFDKGTYNPLNEWNTTRGAVHLTHPANTLGAEINLAADATVLYPSVSAAPANTLAARLICCAGYGGVNRSSDPAIGAAVNGLARQGNCVTLENPVGLYMSSFDLTGLTAPDGTPIPQALHVVRAGPDGGRILRVEIRVPPGATYTLDQCRLDLEPLKFGGQVARKITMVLFGLAKPIPGRAGTHSACRSKCCSKPDSPSFSLPVPPNRNCSTITPQEWADAGPATPQQNGLESVRPDAMVAAAGAVDQPLVRLPKEGIVLPPPSRNFP